MGLWWVFGARLKLIVFSGNEGMRLFAFVARFLLNCFLLCAQVGQGIYKPALDISMSEFFGIKSVNILSKRTKKAKTMLW